MLVVLKPTYTLSITIKRSEPNYQAALMGGAGISGQIVTHPGPWANAKETGCDEVVAAVRKALIDAGLPADVRLTRYEETA